MRIPNPVIYFHVPIRFAAVLIGLLFCLAKTNGQLAQVINEVRLHEKTIGQMGFFQADINGDGKMDFLADGDSRKHIAICTITDNDIVVLHQYTIPDVNDFDAFLYEDADGDGKKEIYIHLEGDGLIRLNNELVPVDTFHAFKEFTNLEDLKLVDIDQDLLPEWIVLDLNDGLVVVDPVTAAIQSSFPTIDGSEFLAGNVTGDPLPELVLKHNSRLFILDPVTGVFEDTIQYSNLYDYQLVDFEQNGRHYIVARELNKIDVYDGISKTSVGNYTPPLSISFEGFFPFQLDADPTLELVLYNSHFTGIIWLNTFPFHSFNQYDIRGMHDIGTFLAKSEFSGDPNDLLFVRDEIGLVQFNLLTREASHTHVRDMPNALHYLPFGSTTEKHVISIPRPGNTFITVLDATDHSTHLQLDGEQIFSHPALNIQQSVSPLWFRGIPDTYLLLQDGEDFVFYNTKTRHYRLYEGYGNHLKLADDLDYDGTSELLIPDDDGITVYSLTPGFELNPLFTTPPGSSGYSIIAAQVNAGKTKEIIAFNNQHIRIYSGVNGQLIRERLNVVSQNISTLLPFTDGKGLFYLGLVGSTAMYIYGLYEDTLVDTITFSSGSGNVAANMLQFTVGGEVRNYFVFQKDALRIYNGDGGVVYQNANIKTAFNQFPGLPIDDIDLNGRPNILASTADAYVELELLSPGQYAKPFYLTSIFPTDSATVGKEITIELQFSAPVDAQSAANHIQIVATNQGEISFVTEQRGPAQLQLILEPIQSTPATLTIAIDGNLSSTLQHKLDINYDGLSMSNGEAPFTAVLFVANDPAIPQISVAPLASLPEIVYSATNRRIPFEVVVSSALNNESPVGQLGYRIDNSQPLVATPADYAYDETNEIVMLALNTFGLEAGTHTLSYWADSPGALSTDTFTHVFEVIHEAEHIDKHPGGNQQRTSAVNNQVIGDDFELVATIPHGDKPISHVVGGQGTFTYIEYSKPGFGNTGILKNLTLHDQVLNWEHTLPLIGPYNPPHLDHGLVYATSTTSGGQGVPRLHVFDVITGDEILNFKYESSWGAEASPVTNDQYLILPDSEHFGMYCVDRWTGQHHWFGQSTGSVFTTGAPSIYKDKVYDIHDENIQVFDLETGELVWNIVVDEADIFQPLSAVIDTLTGTLFWPGSARLYAFDITTGDQKWSASTGESRRNVVVYGHEVIHFTNNRMRFFNIQTGALTRSKAIPFAPAGQPVAANGKLFLNLYDNFSVLDLNTLDEIWSLPIEVRGVSVLDTFLLLTDEANNLHIYRSSEMVSTPAPIVGTGLQVLPNPFTNKLQIRTDAGAVEYVEVIDALGQLHVAGHPDVIDYDVLPGMYFLRIHLKGRTYFHPVVKME